jgi:hypothetical protein
MEIEYSPEQQAKIIEALCVGFSRAGQIVGIDENEGVRLLLEAIKP